MQRCHREHQLLRTVFDEVDRGPCVTPRALDPRDHARSKAVVYHLVAQDQTKFFGAR